VKKDDKKNQRKSVSAIQTESLNTKEKTQMDHQVTSANVVADKPVRLDPTRYGDWEKNGRCIDF